MQPRDFHIMDDLHFCSRFVLQWKIIQDNIGIRSVFLLKALRNRSNGDKSQLFVQFPCCIIFLYNRIELQNAESHLPSLMQAVPHQLFPDFLPSVSGLYSIAGITDMSAPSNIVRVQDIHTHNLCGFCIISRCSA